eukprot:TRINITY_DN4238_c0_g3_i1.p1 TRINITY_DN4238_c0_g3~~TRINITY_DN4238_c0_g3_i1.p1  ORF type:complete len:1026 (-),score=270.26 TRINITY_DN4238_c0_g3_i1:108-3185(-)
MSSDGDWKGASGEERSSEEEEPPTKKQKTNDTVLGDIRSLFDDAAEASSEDSDDEIPDDSTEFDPEFIEEGDEEPTEGNFHRRHVAHHLDNEGQHFEKLARDLELKYGETGNMMDYGDDQDNLGRSAVAQEARQPSTTDPRLWLVKCQVGQERTIATCLMSKYLQRQAEGNPLQIFSVVTQDHLKGIFYVEAYKDAHVREAIAYMSGVFQREVKPIAHSEMVSVLTPPRKTKNIKKDDWVKVKKGLYAGDVGQVHQFDEAQQEITVKLIPRLSLDTFKDDEEEEHPRKRGRKDNRPLPALFDAQRMQTLFGNQIEVFRDRYDAEAYYKYGGNKYKDGFLYKELSVKAVEIGVKPRYEDIKAFARIAKATPDDDDDEAATERAERLFASQAIRLAAQTTKVVFEKGDVVCVTEGELQGLIGVVQSVNGDVAKVSPKLKDFSMELPFPVSQLQKHFQVGDHVKVINGQFKGETGSIYKIQKEPSDVAVILTDLGLRELQVFMSDIQLAATSEVATGASLSDYGYKRNELVMLVGNAVGVIVSIDSDSATILDIHGKLKQVKVQSIKMKKNSARAVSQDADGNPIGKGELVSIIDGPFSGEAGSVLHIFKYFAFVHSKTRLQDNGVFVVRAKSCKLQGSSKNSQFLGHGRRDMGRIPAKPVYGSGTKTARRRVDPDLNKTISIIRGPYKGHIGVIKSATDSQMFVRLQTTQQKVLVPRESIVFLDERSGNSTPREDPNATPYRGNQTPMHTMTPYRPNTPIHEYSSGSFTPRATPFDSWTDDQELLRTPVTGGGGGGGGGGGIGGGGGGGGSYSENEYSTYNTPIPTTPGTPGLGGYNTPYEAVRTPSTPGTPGLYSNNQVYTPQDNIYSPGTPATPGHGQFTPGTPGTSLYGEMDTPNEDDSIWWCPNAEVIIQDESSPYNGYMGYIKEVLGGSCVVGVYSSHRTSSYHEDHPSYPTEVGDVTVAGNVLLAVKPEKHDRVVLIKGANRHQVGKLIGVDAPDGIVNINEAEISILKLDGLARVAEWKL